MPRDLVPAFTVARAFAQLALAAPYRKLLRKLTGGTGETDVEQVVPGMAGAGHQFRIVLADGARYRVTVELER